METFRHVLQQIIHFPDEEWDRLNPIIGRKERKKGEFVVQSGEVCREIFFVKKGCLRMYYLNDGHEQIRQFFFENAFTTDLESFLTGKKSVLYIEAIEQTDILTLSKVEVERLYEQSTFFDKLGRIVAEQNFLGLANRMANLFLKSPEEMYIELQERNSKILQRVPQYMVASYLGITPEGLSRIRKRLAKKGLS